MRVDVSLLPSLAAAFMLVFARIGTMVMLLPGLGELSVPVRIRLTIALLLALLLLPLHRQAYQIDLRAFGPVLSMLGQEILIGVMLGMTARLAMSAMQVAGAVIAHQLGLSFAVAVDPTHGGHSEIVATFLTVLAITLIFATDMHHLVIAALHDSYTLFAPGTVPLMGDIAALTTQTIAAAFKIGVQLAAPFLAFGLLFNLGLGVLSRLMPQMQVYFVGMPLSIWLGLLILVMVLGALMTTFLGSIENVLRQLAPNI
jgi:flagellar biosynthetic protein FliR